jgi:hypothetical protein
VTDAAEDGAAIITAVAALIAAIGGIVAAVLAHRARKRVDVVEKALITIDGEVREVGKRIDGRLSELLRSSGALARAEGVAQGEQAQRDRSAVSDVP